MQGDEYSIPPSPLAARQFWQSAILLFVVFIAGWASRRYAIHLPHPIRRRTGDALWACAVFAILSIFRPRWSTIKVAIVALFISYCVEFSQIYHRPWIDHIRSYAIGKLILGTTFFWLDQVAYTIGIAAIAPVDFLLISRRKTTIQ